MNRRERGRVYAAVKKNTEKEGERKVRLRGRRSERRRDIRRYRRNKAKGEGSRNRVSWMDVKNKKFCKMRSKKERREKRREDKIKNLRESEKRRGKRKGEKEESNER